MLEKIFKFEGARTKLFANNPPRLLLALSLVVFALAALNVWHVGFNWHDQQRIYQLILLSITAVLLLFQRQHGLPPLAFALFSAVFGLGLLSSLLADWPFWALKEWGRYAGLTILVLFMGENVRQHCVIMFVLALMTCVGFIHAFQFVVYYSAAFISDMYVLDANLLFNGFSNPRFFGQFQIMLMPVLAGLVLYYRQRKPVISMVLFSVLVLQWCIALTLGGRGLWLGLAVSTIVLMVVARRYWRLIAVQIGAGLLGGVLFFLLFHLLPAWLDIAPDLRESLRSSLSGRERIWLLAWEMVKTNPWLGVGPMHYSATYNPIAAHPHQVLLQWAAEWGSPAMLMALTLGLWGMVHGIIRLLQDETDHIAAVLWLAIAGALILAQVDGVFVMPYTETWLAVLIGLALTRWSKPRQAPPTQRVFFRALAIPVVLIIGSVLIYEVPSLLQDSEAHRLKHHVDWTPRFWGQGWIPMDGTERQTPN